MNKIIVNIAFIFVGFILWLITKLSVFLEYVSNITKKWSWKVYLFGDTIKLSSTKIILNLFKK